MLTVTKIPNHVAIKIALELKKLLIDNSLLYVSQSNLEVNLFKVMERRGYREEYISHYKMMTRFHHQRVPLVILVCGTACVGKSTIATQLAQRLNYQMCCRIACFVIFKANLMLGAGVSQVIVSGKLRAQRAKSMKFKDGYMISSGQPVKNCIDSAVRHAYTSELQLKFYGRAYMHVVIDNCNKGKEKTQLKLDWSTRRKICIGVAKDLAYLHGESRLKIANNFDWIIRSEENVTKKVVQAMTTNNESIVPSSMFEQLLAWEKKFYKEVK
ncbi:hypothetical protein HN51_069988, partial [Arachis hypogaea]